MSVKILNCDASTRLDDDGDTRLELAVEISNEGERAYKEIEAMFIIRDSEGKMISSEDARSDGPLLPRTIEFVRTSAYLTLGGRTIGSIDCQVKLIAVESLRASARIS